MLSFEDLIRGFADTRVLILGDVMLDRFVYGRVGRVSPEAPALVIHAKDTEEVPGGAANVARIVSDLGAACTLVSVVGRDEAGLCLASQLQAAGVTTRFAEVDGRPTTVKQRFVSSAHNSHLLRADWEDASPIGAEAQARIMDLMLASIPEADVVVLSDYAKGLLTRELIDAVIAYARDLAKPVVVDPKGIQFERYAGCTVITPNLKELSDDIGRAIPNHEGPIAEAARALQQRTGCEAVIVTRGEAGLLVAPRTGETTALPSSARKVIDVAGAGDALTAGVTLALAGGSSLVNAARLANAAAGVVVGKRAVASLTPAELADVLLSRPDVSGGSKVMADRRSLAVLADDWREQGLVVGFTNGCFDILHPGHIELLREARSQCDRLIVGINTDASVQRLKGPNRPVQNEYARATVLAALSFVDMVIAFDEDTPYELIKAVQPDVLIKGADYALEQVVGRDVVEVRGGRVHLARLVPQNSTTDIVQRIRVRYADDDAAPGEPALTS